jgi:hypothetical protein
MRERPSAGPVNGRAFPIGFAVLVVWASAWVFIGVRTAEEVHGLQELSDTVVDVGAAVRSSGETIQSLSSLPVVGDRLEGSGERIVRAGDSAVASGRASRDSVRDLSVLLGISIAVIPTVPLVVLFVLLPRRRE